MIEVLQDVPRGLLNLVARENHVDARFDRVFNFDRQNAGVAVKVLGLSFEAIETMGILQIQFSDTSHWRLLTKLS